jgi:DNA-binding MarR family transcriptional regulator
MNNPLLQLVRTFGLLERVMQPYFARFGISGPKWGVLRTLYRAEQAGDTALRPSELSDRLLIRPPSATGLIDRLERAELVMREASPSDSRAKQIKLTRAGRQLVERILLCHDEQLGKVLAGLTPAEQEELKRLLGAWGDHLHELLRGEERRSSARPGVDTNRVRPMLAPQA